MYNYSIIVFYNRNEEERDCHWSGIIVSTIHRIGLIFFK